MPNLALPLLVVAVLPVLWLLHRTGLIRRGPPLWIAGAVAGVALVAVVATTSRSGMDLVHLKRVQLLLAALDKPKPSGVTRPEAIHALGSLDGYAHAAAVRPYLQSANADERLAAVQLGALQRDDLTGRDLAQLDAAEGVQRAGLRGDGVPAVGEPADVQRAEAPRIADGDHPVAGEHHLQRRLQSLRGDLHVHRA